MSIELTALQQQRRDTAANWTGANPTLLNAELAYETDTGKFKIGDGSTAWTSLSYLPIPDVNGLIPIDQLLLPAGTAAAPSLTFTGDVNTGVYSPGADQFGISTAGSEKMRIDSSGNVDIGSVISGGYVSGALIQSGGKIASYVSNSTAASDQRIYVYNGSTASYTANINANGSAYFASNVGIGTTANADSQLHVKSGANDGNPVLRLEAATNNFLNFRQTGSVYDIHVTAGDPLSFSIGASERMRIDSSGRLLVGTTTEGQVNADELTIANIGDCGLTIRSSTSTTGNLFFSDGTSGTAEYSGAIVYDHSTDSLELYAGNGSERMRIDSLGNVGIGTTTNLLSSSTRTTLSLNNSGSAAVALGVNGTREGHIYADASSMEISATDNLMYFTAGNSERLRIDSSGNVGIGTSSPQSSLSVAGSIPNAPSIEGVHLGLTSNYAVMQLNGNTGGIIDFSEAGVDNAGRIIYTHSTDAMQFSTAASTKMTIDSSGNVGIGTTSPSDTLHLNGATGYGLKVTDLSSLNPQIGVYRTHSDGAILKTASSHALLFGTNDTERMRIDSSGNVGIGKSSNLFYRLTFAEGSGDASRIGWVSGSGNRKASIDCGNTAALVFRTDVSDTERMRIDSAGNVGIGITNPGDYHASANNLVMNGGMTLANTSQGSIFFADSATGTGEYVGQLNYYHSDDSMAFVTANTERVRIAAGGSVKITANSNVDCIYSGAAATGTSSTVFRGSHSATTGTPGSGTDSIYIFANGNIQNTNDSYGQISDIKLKENIVDAPSQWSDFKAVRFRKYNFKEETGHGTHTQLGVIAQELELTSPGLVYETVDKDSDGKDLGTTTKAVKSSILTKKALVALQEAMERIETLEQRLSDAGIA